MVFEKVQKILSDQFEVEEDTITLDSKLEEDFGADSLDSIDLIMSIEDEFEIDVPDDIVENMKTVSDIVDYIENK